jgi:mannosyltransferase
MKDPPRIGVPGRAASEHRIGWLQPVARARWTTPQPTVLIVFALATAALTILALALDLHALGAKSLDFDESVSVDHARRGLGALWSVVSGGDPNMGLYYVLLHGWVRVFGETETAVRALSAISAAAAIPVVALLGARLFGRRAGLIAGLLAAVDAMLVQYAQTARSYGLLVLLVSLSSYLFVLELERPSPTRRAAYVAVTALAVYAHYFAAFVVLVQLLTLIATRRRAALRQEWVAAGVALGVLCVPAVVFAATSGTGLAWLGSPSLHDLVNLPVVFAGGSAVAAALLVALGCYAILAWRDDPSWWRVGFVAVWFTLPVLLAFLVSLVKPIFVTNYLIITLPAFVLLAAAGLARLPSRPAAAVVLGLIVVLSAGRLPHWYDFGSLEDYRAPGRYIAASMRPGDRIAYDPAYAGAGIEFYERAAGTSGPAVIHLRSGALLPTRPGRLWLVIRGPQGTPEHAARLVSALGPGYRSASGRSWSGGRIQVLLYQSG